MLLSSLKSFGFNTTVSWENNSCVHIHLRYTYFYSFDIGIFEYTILNNSLFCLFTQKTLYMYYMLVCVCFLYLQILYKNSCTDSHRRACIFTWVFMLYIIWSKKRFFVQCTFKGPRIDKEYQHFAFFLRQWVYKCKRVRMLTCNIYIFCKHCQV